jgi:hypothetical protein
MKIKSILESHSSIESRKIALTVNGRSHRFLVIGSISSTERITSTWTYAMRAKNGLQSHLQDQLIDGMVDERARQSVPK